MLGWYDGRRGPLWRSEIPKLLSLLAFHDPNARVQGLDAVPADDRPPVNVVRVAFQTMVGIGTMLARSALLVLCRRVARRRLPESRWFYRALVAAGPLSVVALIAGWVTTEVGRQPWVVYGVMRTEEAVTGRRRHPGRLRDAGGRLPRRRRRGRLDPAAPGPRAARRGRHSPTRARRGAERCTSTTVPLVFVLVGLVLYTVLAGADFGAGFWQLTAIRGERGAASAITPTDAMGPVWEANHVWLIFVLTVMWTAYPTAFGSIASTLCVPLFIAGDRDHPARRRLRACGRDAVLSASCGRIDTAFAVSSMLTPFALGAVVGGIASGRVPVGNARGRPASRAG